MAETRNRLEGKIALVTGAASGIGLAVTQTFLSHGAKVFGVDFSQQNIDKALSILQAEGFEKSSHIFQLGDVAHEEVVQSFVQQCAQDLGRLDIAVLNAGIGVVAPISKLTVEEYDRHMRINARGRKCRPRVATTKCSQQAAFLGVKYVAPKMQELGKGGSIIITASLASEAAYAELCAYNMSKFAVRALAVTAAQEYARDKIRVNCVSPGFVATPLVQAWDNLEARLKATPAGKPQEAIVIAQIANGGAGRAVEPMEVAKLYLFLGSDDAALVSGSNYRMDGGMLLH
jgi:NAD(P)-dependent dehydrogenase (short-subunit alcohol dehydrogenase family)